MTNQITTYTNYQLSSIGVGVIATGLSDIRQCIDIILRTIPGSDPLRPLFGSNIYKYVDAPVTTGIPNMKKEIFEALAIWEKRIEVTAITHQVNKENVNFRIVYKAVDENLIDFLEWSLNGIVDSGGGAQDIILSALIPGQVTNGRYNVEFVLNGEPAYPALPTYGFGSAQEMLNWVNEFYIGYGNWFLTADKLIVYLKPGIAKTASLVVTQKAITTYIAFMRPLNAGEFYNVEFVLDGITAAPLFPINTINNAEGLLSWVQSNWAIHGDWFIKTGEAVLSLGDFNGDFNTDFSTGGILVDRYLVFQTSEYNNVTLNIS